jgi:hypothetical protein
VNVQPTNEVVEADDKDWTIRVVNMPERKPVTLDTVKVLLRDKDLRGVARIALKYSK